MKKLGTIVFLLALASGIATAKTHPVVSKQLPVVTAPSLTNSVFLTPRKYVKEFAPEAFRYDTLFYTDTSNLPLPYSYLPSFVNEQSSGGGVFTDTIISYSERFTAPVSEYLDSVFFILAIADYNQLSSDSLNANALQVKVKSQIQPTGRVPFQAFGKALDSTSISYDDLSVFPTDGHFFGITVPLHHKKVPANFFVEVLPAIDYSAGLDPSTQSYYAILHDSINLPDISKGVDISKVRGYFTTKHQDTSVVSIFIDRNDNTALYYQNYWMMAWLTSNPNNGAVENAQVAGNSLAQNFPNPINPSTEIRYSIADHGNVTLKVYNALGIEMKTLVDAVQDAGEHSVNFYGDDLPSGTYYYTLKTGSFSETKRMVLAK
jgi:hypothetical protein